MKTCPPPNGSLLPAQQQDFLAAVYKTFTEAEFRQSRIHPWLPSIIEEFNQRYPNDDDLLPWCDELGLWVRWFRVPAYHLANFFQLLAKSRNSLYFFAACELFSDAQTLFADDLALSSLETAYVALLKNQSNLGTVAEAISNQLQRKLQQHYDYYHRWSRPFDYIESNPCTCHLYYNLSRSWLVADIREQEPDFDIGKADHLVALIKRSQSDDVAFYRILGRRFLGLLYDAQRQYDASIEQYENALSDARTHKLDTEIGHLRRLLG